MRSIRDIKKKIEKNDLQKNFGPLIDKVADYSIRPETLDEIKSLDNYINKFDTTLIRNINLNKN